MMDLFSLKNQVIVITGGGGLIGKEISDALAFAGANLVLIDTIDKNKLIKQSKVLYRKYKVNVMPIYADITDEKIIKISISNIIKKF